MKKIISLFMVLTMVLSLAACSTNQSPSESTPEESSSQTNESTPTPSNTNGKNLVVYFSMPDNVDDSTVVIDGETLGNTQYMAYVIQETVGADIFRIEPETPYPTDHDELVDLASEEQSNNARPAIKDTIENFDTYENIFVGYPNWWGDMPMILYSFFDEYDFSGKTIIPFNTHGGSGKTRFWLKPNLLQCHSSYVITDPKGSIGVECGEALLKHGYKLKFFNSINFSKSMKYNPMAYIHSEKDILKLVTALMTNTKGEGQGGDPFWDKAERLLLVSLIAYLHYEAPVEEQNFATLLEMLNTMQVSEDDETYQNPVDLLFEDLGKKKPKSFAVRQYKLYKLAAGKTAKSILISCGARLAPFDIQEVRDATMYDELELDKLGDRKTVLFLIMSDTDSTFNFLISMIYTQLFNLLCDKADDVYGGKLPIHVRCLIDECANIGQIPQLEKLVATIRSREISACLVLQTRSQLKAIYKDNADTIVGNMDSQIFLGGSEPTTLKDLAEALGKETIDSYNNSDTRGNSPSYGTNYQKLGHELMSRDELAVLDGGKCILQLRGVRPFLSDKYDLTQHPNYKYTSDYDPKNALDIEKFLNRKEKIHPDDTFIMVDADSLPPA